ncbi:MAG: Ig-like domain-containing protein [Gemmatimonadota bacterium]|nr:Ig-like domain-containing protein [Gemmatimonadota bacterium]
MTTHEHQRSSRARLHPAGPILAIAAVLSCGEEPVEPPPPVPVPTTLTVRPASFEFVSLGETERFTAEVRDQFGNVMSVAVTWSSSADAVAGVNPVGVVTSEAVGTATIRATAGAASGTAAVTVIQRVASISVLPEAFTLVSGGSVQASATAEDANGHAISGADLAWTSDDGAVATVDESGRVDGIAVGTASILAAADGTGSASEIAVVVPPPVRSVEMRSLPANGGAGHGAGSWELPPRQVFTTTLRAVGNPGYDFEGWTEGDAALSADSVYPMQLAGAHSIAANFSVNPERGKWGPGNTYTDYEFPGTAYETLAWTFLPAADPPQSLSDKGLLHYYAYNFGLMNRTPAVGYGYAGFVTDGHLGGSRWGKAVNFSVWGSNAARSDGLIEPNNDECGCHQIMLLYEWVEGRRYRFELGPGPGGVDAEGKWWGLWVTDLATDSTSFVGEQRVPAMIGGRPSTMWEPNTSFFGEDLYWWRSRDGRERFICSDFEASSLAVLDVTAGDDEDRPVRVHPWTNSGWLDVAENGYETTLCHVTVFRSGDDTQHNVGFWPEPPENVLMGGEAGIRR